MKTEPTDLVAAAAAVNAFAGTRLTARIASLEAAFEGASAEDVRIRLSEAAVSHQLLAAATLLKRAAGQINVVVHTAGILLCLPQLLDPHERVEYLSLGAGNTGRPFDLETSERVAEFKFIDWQGGSEAIRQNALFLLTPPTPTCGHEPSPPNRLHRHSLPKARATPRGAAAGVV